MAFLYNIFHWDEGMDSAAIFTAGDARYLKLDQSGTPQAVTGGTPTFNEGITATATGDTAITANKNIVLKAGQRLIFDGD